MIHNNNKQISAATEIEIGFLGWDYDHWEGLFYPDDLPQDWRFSYYSNEFRTVLIPWDYLQSVEPNTVQQWFEDVDDDFEFYVEVPLDISWERLSSLIDPFDGQLSGVLLSIAKQDKHPITYDVAKVRELIQNLQHITRLIVDHGRLGVLPEDVRNQLQTDCGCYVCHRNLDTIQCNSNLALIEINDSGMVEPRVIRELLEKCFKLEVDRQVLVFSGDKPNVSSARNAATVYQLMAG